MANIITRTLMPVIALYTDGFKAMKVGRKLWLLIVIKLIILFGVMKLFFFPDVLHTQFESDTQRSMHVLENLTKDR